MQCGVVLGAQEHLPAHAARTALDTCQREDKRLHACKCFIQLGHYLFDCLLGHILPAQHRRNQNLRASTRRTLHAKECWGRVREAKAWSEKESSARAIPWPVPLAKA